MISDADLDRVLTAWLADGSEHAPADDVAAAVRQAAGVAQRRPIVGRLGWGAIPDGRRWVILAAAALLAVALAVGVGSVLVTRLRVTPVPMPLPSPGVTVQPSAAATALRPLDIEDWSVDLAIPSTWNEVESGACCDTRLFAGTSPEGRLSVGHESPYTTAACGPECTPLEVQGSIPYSATAQLEALKASVAAVAGSTAWTDLPPGVLPELVGGAQVETTTTDDAGREWRRIHIVGLRNRNLVAITWSQPSAAWSPSLFSDVLAAITLPSGPIYSDGDLIADWKAPADFAMPIPGLWQDVDQPTAEGKPLSGVHRMAAGRVLVSFGDAEGNLGWCDPDCRILAGQTSLDALVESVLVDAGAVGLTAAEIDGEDGVRGTTATEPLAQAVVTMHDGRPVAIRIDAGDWDVAPEAIDQMFDGFTFVEPLVSPSWPTHTTAGGRATIQLPEAWIQSDTDDTVFTTKHARLTVRAGRANGSILKCDFPAGPWDPCSEVTVTSLEDLNLAVASQISQSEAATLDGEPSVILRTLARSYPGRSGKDVAYVVAMHRDRPYILRYLTGPNGLADLDALIEGFRFVDPQP